MRLNLLILLGFAFLLGSTQVIGNIGGYQPYTALNSAEFQAVQDFIYSVHPQIKGYSPSSVSRQLVNGFNYNVTLTSSDGCQVVVIVYVAFQGDSSISSFNALPCVAKTVDIPVVVPINKVKPILAGSYKVQSNPSGSDFENALAQALAKNPQYTKGDLVLVETQVVSGTNYRFTFRNSDGSLNQVVIYVPLFSISGSIDETPASIAIAGGYTELTSASEYQQALNAVYSQDPQVKQYRLTYAAEQIVAGKNYKFSFSSNSDTRIKYASYIVYVDLSGVSTVTQTSWIDVGGYSVQQINQALASTIAQHPEVKESVLQGIVNIWQNDEGLSLKFIGSKKYQVFIYQLKGKTLNLIY